MRFANGIELGLAAFFLVSGFLLTGLAMVVSRRRTVRGRRYFTALLAVTAFWAVSAGVKLLAPRWLEYVLVIVELPLGVLFAVVFFAFASAYTGRAAHRSRWFITYVTVVYAGTVGLVLTNSRHGLLWADVRSSSVGFPHLVHVDIGPMYVALVLVSYLLYFAGIYYLMDLQVRSRYHTGSLGTIIVGCVSPLAVNVLSILDLVPITGLDYTPFGLLVLGLATTHAIQEDLFEIVPIARDTAVEYSSEGIIILDPDERIRDYNPTAERLLPGLPDHAGEPLTDIFDDGFRLDADSEKRTKRIVRNGSVTYLTVMSGPITDGDFRLGWTVVISDVTEQKRRERHLRLVRRVLRHNISNRVVPILALAEELESHVDEAGRDHLDTISDNANRIVDTSTKLRQIQEIVTSEHGRTATELTTPIRTVAENFSADYPEASLTVTCPEQARAYCTTGLRMAIENLVENGIEHNDADRPRVDVSVTTEGDVIHVSVADDGPGITRYERQILEEGETPTRHSSGVGLWLVYYFVEKSGGDLSFAKTNAGGTEVTMTLDRASQTDSASTNEVNSTATGEGVPRESSD